MNPAHSPFVLQNGKSRNVIFETPHLGRQVPQELQKHGQLVSAAEQRWDNFIDRAGQYLLDSVGGVWMGSVFSRMVADLNRGADRVDSRTCPRWPGARIHEDGGAIVPFIRNKQGRISLLYSKPLEPAECENRLQHYWYPYHDKLQEQLDATQKRFGHSLLIGLHSAVPEPLHHGGNKPVVYIGTCNGTTCDKGIVSHIRGALENRNISVIAEGFYQGAFTIQAYGKDPQTHAVQIELDRRFMETEKQLTGQLEPLAAALQAVSISGGLPSSVTPSRSNRFHGSRTYVDPLSGEVLPY